MKINSIFINSKDNVVTTLKPVEKGTDVIYKTDEDFMKIESCDDVPVYHKVAMTDIHNSEYIYKYGEVIGVALRDIKEGEYVSHMNIDSVPRDYDKETSEMTGA